RPPIPSPLDTNGRQELNLAATLAQRWKGVDMENQTKMGMNRTGMQMSPIEGPDQVQYALDQPPHPAEGNDGEIAALRAEYVREATRIGSVPLPGTGKGLMDTTIGKIKGKNPEVLIDKLGQRLAYERSGVRLYQAVITKVEAAGHPRQ